MSKARSMLHLSSINIWNIGQNKGRVSLYLPLKGFVDRGYKVCFLTNFKNERTRYINGILSKMVWVPLHPWKRKNFHRMTTIMLIPINTIFFLIYGILQSINNRPFVVYCHTADTALPSYLLAKLLRAKYVLRLYGIGNIDQKFNFFKKIDLYLAFWLRADLYILTNDGTYADRFALARGVKADKIHFLKNGIEKSKAYSPIDTALKAKLAPQNEKLIISVSRLVSSKQIDLIIKAMPKLIKLNEKIKLIIVGDGIEREYLKTIVKINNLDDFVTFTGSLEQSDVIEYIKVADIFVSMNSLSSMSNPVFEAMLCGKPVIALNKGNTEELIKDNVTGILVQPSDVDDLPSIITKLLNDNGRMSEIGQNAQRLIMNGWPTWEERINYEVSLIGNLK